MKILLGTFLTLLILVLMTGSSLSNDTTRVVTADFDTTRVRDVKPVKKSVSETLADIPGELLKLPIYTFEFVTKQVVMNPPLTSVLPLFQKRGERTVAVPMIGYSTRAGLKLGFAINILNSRSTGVRLRFKSYYSTNEYQLYRLRFGLPQFFSTNIGLNISAQYKKETRQSLYGIGMTSARSSEVNLTREDIVLEARLPVEVTKSLRFSLYSRGQTTNVFDGTDPDIEGSLVVIADDTRLNLMPGQLDALRHIDFGLELEFDSRDHEGRPTSGSHLLGNFEHLSGVGRSEGRDFDAFNIDLSHYIHLWRKRTLAIRANYKRIDATGATSENPQATPYYLLNRLGGLEALRGYTSGRFVDNDAVHVSVEYRYPIYTNVAAFVSLDEGRVYRAVTREPVFDNWRNSIGFGLRIFNSQKALAVVQIARSDESTRIYFDIGATW